MKPHILLFLLLAGCVEPKPALEVIPQPSPPVAKPEVKKPIEAIPAPKVNIRLPVCQDIPGDSIESLNLKLDCVRDHI